MSCGCTLRIDTVRPTSQEGRTRYLGCRFAVPGGDEDSEGGGSAIVFCTGPSSHRLRPADFEGNDRMGPWAAVVPGDLVQVRGRTGQLLWWRVLQHRDDGAVLILGDGGTHVWAKPAPSPWEVTHGWHAIDPGAIVRIVSTGARIGGPSMDEAAALVRAVLGGRELPT